MDLDCINGQSAGFVGRYPTGNSTYITGPGGITPSGSEGNWVPFGSYIGMTAAVAFVDNALIITGPGGDIGVASEFKYSIKVIKNGTFRFNWRFDWSVNPSGNQREFEQFGVVVNDVYHLLAVSADIDGVFSLAPHAEGNFFVDVIENDIIGFHLYAAATDGFPTTATITDFSAPC